jgi:hypothetical protein
MKCFDCDADLTPGKRFCGNCGREIRKHNGNGNLRKASGIPRKSFPIPEAMIALKAWEAAKEDQHTKLMRKLRIIAGIIMLVSGIYCWSQNGDATAGVIFAAGALLLLFSLWACSLVRSEHVYYAFPGSRGANGEHQCIFCGGRGVHKRTPYQTNSTIANCSKCRENLWQD